MGFGMEIMLQLDHQHVKVKNEVGPHSRLFPVPAQQVSLALDLHCEPLKMKKPCHPKSQSHFALGV